MYLEHSTGSAKQRGLLTPDEEKQIIKALTQEEDNIKAGASYFILSSKWHMAYVHYENWVGETIEENIERPGPIENKDLLEDDSEDLIKRSAMDIFDYVIVSEKVGDLLHKWYGGGPVLKRVAITAGWRGVIVEVRPLQLKIYKSSDMDHSEKAQFSRIATVGDFLVTMCKRMKLEVEKVRVWDFHQGSKLKLLDDLSKRLNEMQIIEGQQILLEEQNSDGTLPESHNSNPKEPESSPLAYLQSCTRSMKHQFKQWEKERIKREANLQIQLNQRVAEVEAQIELKKAKAEEFIAQQKKKFEEECIIARQNIENERKQLQDAKESFAKEKQDMAKLHKQQNSIVKLDIGGHMYKTSVTTLTTLSGYFQVMFSGRYEVQKDEDGAIFIDRDGSLFKYILNFLRQGKVPKQLAPLDIEELLSEAEYYQIDDSFVNLLNQNLTKE